MHCVVIRKRGDKPREQGQTAVEVALVLPIILLSILLLLVTLHLTLRRMTLRYVSFTIARIATVRPTIEPRKLQRLANHLLYKTSGNKPHPQGLTLTINKKRAAKSQNQLVDLRMTLPIQTRCSGAGGEPLCKLLYAKRIEWTIPTLSWP